MCNTKLVQYGWDDDSIGEQFYELCGSSVFSLSEQSVWGTGQASGSGQASGLGQASGSGQISGSGQASGSGEVLCSEQASGLGMVS